MTIKKICPFSMGRDIKEECVKDRCMAWQPDPTNCDHDAGFCELIEGVR